MGVCLLKKKLTVGIILFFFGLTCASSINADFLDIDNSIHENYDEEELNENETIVVTIGPLLFSEIELLDGNPSEIQQIERILDSIILQFITPYLEINVTDLEITVAYEKKIPSILSKRYGYITGLSDGENTTIYNDPHRVHIKGLDGQFFYQRGLPFLLFSRYFMLWGAYEEIVVENIGANL